MRLLFTRLRDDKKLRLGYSEEAKKFMNSSKADPSYVSKKPDVVEARTKSEVMRLGRNPANRTDLLGQFEIQFGQFKGQTFQWLVQNGLRYSAWMVNSMSRETATSAPLSVNKHLFKEYLTLFPGHSVLGRELYPNFRGPNKYTGIAKNLFVLTS